MKVKIADFYDDEVDAAVDALTAMIEPVLMVGMGGICGGMGGCGASNGCGCERHNDCCC